MFSAVLHFHRVNLQRELPTSSPLIKRAQKGVARSHVAVGLQKEIAARSPGTYSWEIRACFRVGPGRPSALDVSRVGLFVFVVRSDKIVLSATGAVHPVLCLARRDVALYRGEQRLTLWQCTRRLASTFVFEVIKVPKPKRGTVIMGTRDSAEGHVLGWEQAAVPSLSWWSCYQII